MNGAYNVFSNLRGMVTGPNLADKYADNFVLCAARFNMQYLRHKKGIRRVSVITPEGGRVVTLYKSKKKKNKRSRALKPLEHDVRQLGRANKKFANVYLKRHKKSNRKKKDGWMRDFNYNVQRAARKHTKTMKIPRLIRP